MKKHLVKCSIKHKMKALILMLAMVCISSCKYMSPNQQHTVVDNIEYSDEVDTEKQVTQECYAALPSGKKKKMKEICNCLEKKLIPLYEARNSPNTDLLREFLAEFRETAEKLDKKKITEAQANTLMAKAATNNYTQMLQRKAIRTQLSQQQELIENQKELIRNQKQQASSAALMGLGTTMLQMMNPPAPPPPPPAPIISPTINCRTWQTGAYGNISCH